MTRKSFRRIRSERRNRVPVPSSLARPRSHTALSSLIPTSHSFNEGVTTSFVDVYSWSLFINSVDGLPFRCFATIHNYSFMFWTIHLHANCS